MKDREKPMFLEIERYKESQRGASPLFYTHYCHGE